MTRQSPRTKSSIPGQTARAADSPKARPGIGSHVALISALVFTLVGAGLLAVLAIGVIDGVRGPGPLLLTALALGAFALAFRLMLVSRNLRLRPAAAAPATRPAAALRQVAPRRRPQPRPVTRRR